MLEMKLELEPDLRTFSLAGVGSSQLINYQPAPSVQNQTVAPRLFAGGILHLHPGLFTHLHPG